MESRPCETSQRSHVCSPDYSGSKHGHSAQFLGIKGTSAGSALKAAPLPNAASRLEAAQQSPAATPVRSTEPPRADPRRSGPGASPLPSPTSPAPQPTAQPGSPCLSVPSASSPGLAVVAAMVEVAPSPRHPQWEGQPPPSGGGEGRATPHSTAPPPPRNPRWRRPSPRPVLGDRHAPQHGRGHPGPAS